MQYIVKLKDGREFEVPDTALDLQNQIHGGNIVDMIPSLPIIQPAEELPPATIEQENDFDIMSFQELKDYAKSKGIPANRWTQRKEASLRKFLKEYE